MNEQKEQAPQDAELESQETEQQAAPEIEAEAEVETEEVQTEEVQTEENPLQAQLDDALAQIAAQKDMVLRTQAEADNVRRRSAQEADKARKFALEKFSKDLLPVIDNLERALQVEDMPASVIEGIELTLKSFLETVTKYGIEQVNPEQGEAFNPDLHQAISMLPSPEQAANTVIHVMQKGYQLNGRLIRPAMVTVAQG